MSTIINRLINTVPPHGSAPAGLTPTAAKRASILSHIVTSIIYTVVSLAILGIIYPLVITGIVTLIFPHQAGGSMIVQNGKPIGSEIIGQLFTKLEYVQGASAELPDLWSRTACDGCAELRAARRR